VTDSTDSRRAAYMRGELTHDSYYGLLVEMIGERALQGILPGDRTPAEWADLAAADPHLNNVPLRIWDDLHHHVVYLLRYTKREERVAVTGSPGWSLSDSVCVLKCAARRFAGTNLEATR